MIKPEQINELIRKTEVLAYARATAPDSLPYGNMKYTYDVLLWELLDSNNLEEWYKSCKNRLDKALIKERVNLETLEKEPRKKAKK